VADAVREQILAALSDVLYVDDSDFISGDETDLRDLGLDSVRFVLLMKQLDVDRASDLPQRLSENLSVAGWIRELEGR